MSASAEHAQIVAARLRNLVTADQPLLLISQMPRSGGTLLLRLLDGHPACHVFPNELRRMPWSREELVAGPERAWETLHDDKDERPLERDLHQAKRSLHGDRAAYPLLIAPLVQRELFTKLYEPDPRRALDAYMTAYFNGWLDNRNLRGPTPKRWIVAFSPSALTNPRKRERFDELYPDGRVISIVRDPVSWYASAKRWSPRWERREDAIAAWTEAALAARDWHARGRVILVTFEHLLGETQATMRDLATRLGIEHAPELETPTINGLPARANSSFPSDEAPRVSDEPLARGRDDAQDAAWIEREAGALYAELRELSSTSATSSSGAGSSETASQGSHARSSSRS